MRIIYFLMISITFIKCSTTQKIEEQIYGVYERTTSLSGCDGNERMELKKDKITIWNYNDCGTGKMHLSSICYGKWKLDGDRITNLMDSVYNYGFDFNKYGFNEQLMRIIRISHPGNKFKFEYPDNDTPKVSGYYLTYDRTLHLITDTTQEKIIITSINSHYGEWAEYKKVK